MAPVNGATGKPAKGSGSRSRLVQRPVVPVVPITYTQRATKPSAATPAAVAVAPALEPASALPHRQPAESAGEEKVEQERDSPGLASAHHDNQNGVGGQVPETVSSDGADAVTPYAAPAQTADAPLTSTSTSSPPISAHPPPSVVPSEPTKLRFPPAFEPASHNLPAEPAHPQVSSTVIYSPNQAAMPDRIYNHQAHASNGSLVFGNIPPGSGTSSPAPHAPVGYPPATGTPFPAAQPMPVDIYGRPLMVSPTTGDGFVHPVGNHGPPTPHSFHGSQASTQPEELNGFGPRPSNGRVNFPVDLPLQAQHQPYLNSHVPFINHQIQEEALSVARNGYKDAEFADCTLEFVLENPETETRDTLKMAAHRLVIAHSPTLRQLLRTRGLHHGVLRIEIRDEYMRTDALDFAIRTLYGWDFGDGPHLPAYMPPTNLMDDVNLALAYIATARYLQLPLVNMKAVHWASRLVRWETVERICKFVLPIAALTPPTRHGLPTPRDEYALNELLDSVVAFLFSNIPNVFMLDTDAGDCGFARLPLVTSAPPTPLSPNAPAIAHGTSSSPKAHMPRNQRMSVNPRLTQIKFGDIASSNGGEPASQPGTPTYTRRRPTTAETILSRILLNLPFNLLKQALEHPVFAKNAAADPITRAVVAERESRRLRVMDKANTELRPLQEAVERAGKPLIVTQMGDFMVNNMGFKEEVFAGDAPYLVQTWASSPSSAGSVSSS